MKLLILPLIALIVFSGCAALHDDMTPEEASKETTSRLQYIYGSYGSYAYKLPNIKNELAMRGEL